MDDERTDEASEKPSIISQPIFLMAMVLVVFNILLFLWSMKRDSEDDKDIAGEVEQGSKAAESQIP